MRLIKCVGLMLVLQFLGNFSMAQEDIELILTKKYAENGFRDGDYEFALTNYLKLYEKDRDNIEYNYRIGICYTETNIDKAAAIPYLEFVVSHNNYPIRTFYYMGRAFMYNYRFTEAVEAFYEYKMMGVDENLLLETDRLIEMCYYALELINLPENVTFTRLDSAVNSPRDDFYPFITADQSSLVFSSNRTFVEDFQDYISNVFYSDNKRGQWESAQPVPVNTYDDEQVVGMLPDGSKILVYANGDYFTHDVKVIERKGSKFEDLPSSTLPGDLNTDGVEMGACLSADGNTLIFASDRRGGRGGLDLYMAKKDEAGVWGPAENMGSTINSEYDENFPTLLKNGKKLYFSSKGHDGIGGYDFFYSNYAEELKLWTPPRNMGFPISTPLDNTTISFTPDEKYAYISANRKEGFGKLDIYKVTFGADSIQGKILSATVMVRTSQGEVPYTEDFRKAYATVYDKFGNIYAQYEVTAEGYFFPTLFPGEYELEVKFSGTKTGVRDRLIITQDTEDFFSKSYTLDLTD